MAKRKAYRTSTVAVEVTQSRDIVKLFQKYDIEAWEFGQHVGQRIAQVRFKVREHLWVRLVVRAPTKERMTKKQLQQADRAAWRMLFHYLKTSFEAVDYGLFKAEEAFLPWVELPVGDDVITVAEGLLPRLGDMPRLLGSGEDS